jgi:DNA-binding MarR family transcriptional regulator
MRTLDDEITTPQLSILNMLADSPLRMNVIARMAGIRVPSATEQIIRLEKAALVVRSPDPNDSRAVLVRLEVNGRRTLARENRRRDEVIATKLAGLSAAELATVADALPALARLLVPVTGERPRNS